MAARVATDGQIHGRITALLALLVLPFVLVACATLHAPDPILFEIGVLSGLFMDPDMDILGYTGARMRMMRIPVLGLLLGPLWVAYWTPYALLFKHRGISHVPIVGTLTRAIYLLPLYLVLNYYVHFQVHPSHAIFMFCGLCLADLGHWMRDYHGLSV